MAAHGRRGCSDHHGNGRRTPPPHNDAPGPVDTSGRVPHESVEEVRRVVPTPDPINSDGGKTLDLLHPWERKGGWEDVVERGVSHVLDNGA